MNEVAIQKLKTDARLPERAHATDAGMDLFANEDVTLQPGERIAIHTGIAMAIPEGLVGLIWDKSGRALQDGCTTLAGVVDAGYRGEVQVVLLNVGAEILHIRKNEKIAQILFQEIIAPAVHEVLLLEASPRGVGGFGSTGIT